MHGRGKSLGEEGGGGRGEEDGVLRAQLSCAQ
jgi:hypothetical protein